MRALLWACLVFCVLPFNTGADPADGSTGFYLTVLPDTVGPGGEVLVYVGLAGTPSVSPPYGGSLHLPDGDVSFALVPGEFETIHRELTSSSTISFDSANPPGVHLETSVTVDPGSSATVGIAALKGTRSTRAARAPVFGAGDPLTIELVAASAAVQSVDIYAAVVLPAGIFFCFVQDGQAIVLAPANTIQPLTVSANVSNSFSRTLLAVGSLPSNLPTGNYLLIVALGPPGGNILTDYLFLDSSSFSVE
jgi:hypothetical protein